MPRSNKYQINNAKPDGIKYTRNIQSNFSLATLVAFIAYNLAFATEPSVLR